VALPSSRRRHKLHTRRAMPPGAACSLLPCGPYVSPSRHCCCTCSGSRVQESSSADCMGVGTAVGAPAHSCPLGLQDMLCHCIEHTGGRISGAADQGPKLAGLQFHTVNVALAFVASQ
jgi:hypothetical protein